MAPSPAAADPTLLGNKFNADAVAFAPVIVTEGINKVIKISIVYRNSGYNKIFIKISIPNFADINVPIKSIFLLPYLFTNRALIVDPRIRKSTFIKKKSPKI
tara:strand:+ start:2871 stop:3176 length:306 start_codon:yes stop_codon:yes gene_type:complete